MTRTAEAIKHLETIKARLLGSLNALQFGVFTKENKTNINRYKREIAAVEYAIERLQSLDELCKLILKTTIDEAKPWTEDADR